MSVLKHVCSYTEARGGNWSVDSQEIIKIAANWCYILKLKCTKFDFGWGSTPDAAGGARSAYF